MVRWTLSVATIIASWLGMQAVHELGHVLGAWLTGAHIQRVVLTPTSISRTDVVEGTHPLVVVWLGPIIGVLLPFAFWGIAVICKYRDAFLMRFFAGFCCIANGLYLAIGSLDRVGDCRLLLRHGTPIAALWLFGAMTVPLGFCCWNNLGATFGWGSRGHSPAPRTVITVVCGVFVLLANGLIVTRLTAAAM